MGQAQTAKTSNAGRVQGKVAAVTGAARGIGEAIALRLAQEGASVAVLDLDGGGAALAERIVQSGGQAHYWPADVTDEASIARVFGEIADRFGRLDILVNNAGIAGTIKPTHELSVAEWSRVYDVNVKGVFLCTKYAVPLLKNSGGGSIINLSSIYGVVGNGTDPAYCAAKGAVRTLTKNDALSYAPDRIRVNSVHPGLIWTPLMQALGEQSPDPAAFRRQLDALHPIGHLGEPDDIAWGVVFLASDEAKFVTGSELVIDGGFLAR